MTISINSRFDAGNIEVVDATSPHSIQLNIRRDNQSEFLQWFYFSAAGVRNRVCHFNILNAGSSSYPKGWQDYDVVTSRDRQHWYRTPATFDGNTLSWSTSADTDLLWFAYFAPYSSEQHLELIAAATCAPGVELLRLGETSQGRTIDCLKIGPCDRSAANDAVNQSRKPLWIIGRQHPGESMAGWWMEGWIERLLDEDDAASCSLREQADIYIVPNMNPDGVVLGHLRTNAIGVNLNREWSNPSIQRSPEVFYVKQKMLETGVHAILDVHGDEALAYNFIAGTEGINSWNAKRHSQLLAVKNTWAAINPDFQMEYGYPITPAGRANLDICSNQIAERFGCLAMTLEMPFKDTANLPNTVAGWSPDRAIRLGASFVDVAHLLCSDRLIFPA